MTHYIVSDVHLRLDLPKRSEKFADFVRRLEPSDTLIIGGDLCDFSLSTRQKTTHPSQCAGLTALQDFQRRGGELILIAGNHDAYMEGYYRRWLGVEFVHEPLEISCFGFSVHLVHGHLTGPRSPLKTVVSGRAFHEFYSGIPHFIANRVDQLRISGNTRTHAARCDKFMTAYRQYVIEQTKNVENEIFVFGHVHEVSDEQVGTARMIVLGEWENQVRYICIDDHRADLVAL